MTFGNMGEFFELAALKSSGIPLQRIMRPLIVLVSIISVVSFFFSNNVLPYSTAKARTLLYDIRRKKPDINIQAGTFYNGVPDFSIKITTKEPITNRLDNLIIYDHRDLMFTKYCCALRIHTPNVSASFKHGIKMVKSISWFIW